MNVKNQVNTAECRVCVGAVVDGKIVSFAGTNRKPSKQERKAMAAKERMRRAGDFAYLPMSIAETDALNGNHTPNREKFLHYSRLAQRAYRMQESEERLRPRDVMRAMELTDKWDALAARYYSEAFQDLL